MTAPPAAASAAAQLLRGTGKELESVVQGVSMRRTLPPGSRIRIRCDDPGTLAAGEVAAFVLDGALVGHRVWGRAGRKARGWLLTCGDGSSVCDDPVALEQVLGRVIAIRRGDAWMTVPPASARRGWRAPLAWVHQRMVRAALALDVRAARRLVGLARASRRAWRNAWR